MENSLNSCCIAKHSFVLYKTKNIIVIFHIDTNFILYYEKIFLNVKSDRAAVQNGFSSCEFTISHCEINTGFRYNVGYEHLAP